MKWLLLITWFLVTNAFAVCNTPISRNNELLRPTSPGFNGDMNRLYTRLNELPGDCINNSSITSDQFPDDEFTAVMFADESVTTSKIASGVIPSFGKPLRIRAYSSPGQSTWTKQSDVGSILVQVVGAGGGASSVSASAGTHSSFGTHCTGNGGGVGRTADAPVFYIVGAGGTASGGDINLTGASGERGSISPLARGGFSMFGPYGRGAHGSLNGSGGGGAGGYCMKVISKDALGDTETVTIGSGGQNLSGNGNSAPKGGLVLVYEYGR